MTNNFELLQEILRGSKQYSMEGTVLTITGYYTRYEIKLDLANITLDMLEEIAVHTDEEDEY